MSNNKLKYIVVLVVLLAAYSFYQYTLFLDKKSANLREIEHVKIAKDFKNEFQSLINQKQKSTGAIALSLAENRTLISYTKRGSIPRNYFKPLIKKFKKETDYKNIWIQVIDRKKRIIYRSWSKRRGDRVVKTRRDIRDIFKDKKTKYDVNVDKDSISIRAMVPIFDGRRVVGVLEVISHFNSIANVLKKFDTELLVLLDKKYKKILKYPHNKSNFIDGYYIANFYPNDELIALMQEIDIQKYKQYDYFIKSGYLIVPYIIKSYQKEDLAYAFMFKKLTAISYAEVDFLIFKWLAFGAMLLLTLVVFLDLLFFYRMKRQKLYYKNIIDSSTNVVVVIDDKKIIEVNKRFFDFATGYKTLDEFNEEHDSLSDFFAKEEGYLQENMGNMNWLEYLIENNKDYSKVKIDYKGKTLFFAVSASRIFKSDKLYVVIFTDITKEERYKIDLEKLSIIDPLTSIGNRRYFNTRMEDEVSSAQRYKIPLSFIMFDIDFFKKVNDVHGHGVGDDVLVEYSRLIKENLRENDIFCRLGGEEFMIILPYITKSEAYKVAEKLRQLVETHKVVLPITMSFGVTEYIMGESKESILTRVDEAVYEAKDQGRNKVVVK